MSRPDRNWFAVGAFDLLASLVDRLGHGTWAEDAVRAKAPRPLPRSIYTRTGVSYRQRMGAHKPGGRVRHCHLPCVSRCALDWVETGHPSTALRVCFFHSLLVGLPTGTGDCPKGTRPRGDKHWPARSHRRCQWPGGQHWRRRWPRRLGRCGDFSGPGGDADATDAAGEGFDGVAVVVVVVELCTRRQRRRQTTDVWACGDWAVVPEHWVRKEPPKPPPGGEEAMGDGGNRGSFP